MKRLVKTVAKSFRQGEKGFTLIELLIVIAVLGALAAVVVPAVGSFLKTANLAAANTEAANVKTAAMSYLADNGCFPNTSADLMGGTSNYMSAAPDGTYTFGPAFGQPNNNTLASYPTTAGTRNSSLIEAATAGSKTTSGLFWHSATQQWGKTGPAD